jgi:hypothetical protein
LMGSKEPFGGWVVLSGGRVAKAPAFLVDQPSRKSWSANISLLEPANGPTLLARPQMLSWISPQDWELTVPVNKGDIKIRRTGAIIDAGRGTRLFLDRGSDAEQSISPVRDAYARSKEKYGKAIFDWIYDRWRVTYILIGLLALQQLFFFLYRRFFHARPTILSTLSVLAWVGFGVWLSQVYFQSYGSLWDKLSPF